MQQLFNMFKQSKFYLILVFFVASFLQVGQVSGRDNLLMKIAFQYPDQKDWVYVDVPYNAANDTVKANDLINKAAEVFHLAPKQVKLMFLQKELVKDTNISAKKLGMEGVVRVTKRTSTSKPASKPASDNSLMKIAFQYPDQKDWVYVDVPYNAANDTVKANDLINKAAEVFHLAPKQVKLMFLQKELVKDTNISAKQLGTTVVRVTKRTSTSKQAPDSSMKIAFQYPDQKDWVYVDVPYNAANDTVKTNDLINKAAEVFHLAPKQVKLMFLQKELVKDTNISAKQLGTTVVRVTKRTSTSKPASDSSMKIAFQYPDQKDWVYVDVPYNAADDTVKTNDLINKAAEVFHLAPKQVKLMFLQKELVKDTNISAKQLGTTVVRVTKKIVNAKKIYKK